MLKMFLFSEWWQQPQPTGFWQQNGDTILVAVLTALITLLLSEPLKKLLNALFAWIEKNIRHWG